MPISLDYIRQLCLEGESARLDYKRDQYAFIGKSEPEKAELFKDILAMANAFRSLVAYILIGVDEQDGMGNVTGIPKDQFIDDASLQEFINGKTNRPVEFQSYPVPIDDERIVQVIEIPVQKERPYYPQDRFGAINARAVPLRAGSSTHFATPDEIAKMGKEEIIQQNQREIDISLSVPQNHDETLVFSALDIVLDGDPPEETMGNWLDRLDLRRSVTFEAKFAFVRGIFRTFRVDIALENKSALSAEQLEVETFISQCSYKCISEKDCFPERPTEFSYLTTSLADKLSPVQQRRLHPGQFDGTFDSHYFEVNHNGDFTFDITVLGKDMQPVRKSFHILVQIEERHLRADQIEDLYNLIKSEDLFIQLMGQQKDNEQ